MSKVLKAQFNNMCVSGLLLDMQSTVIFAGENKNSSIEVTPNGIGINPGIETLYILALIVRRGQCTRNLLRQLITYQV